LSEQFAGGEESVSGELGERVRALVAAAEGMAAAVRSDADVYAEKRRREAEEEAQRRLREASEQADALIAERLSRIARLSDRIVERADTVLDRLDQADEVKAQLESLAQALGETAQRMVGELEEEGSAVRRPPSAEPELEEHPMADEVRPLRPPGEERQRRFLRPVPESHPSSEEASPHLDDARLVALQMAVAGRSREEVAEHLKAAFDVSDPEPILDHVFAEGFPPSPGA
jgi:trichohyalin